MTPAREDGGEKRSKSVLGILTKQFSLRELLMKTVFLVALVLYKRPADLCNLQVVEDFW